MTDVLIREVAEADYTAWKGLWEQYLVFYETELPSEHNDLLWRRFFADNDPVECLVAEVTENVIGMVQFFPHANTWTERPVCYLQDLYVDPGRRGLGVGASLIRSVQSRARDRDWASIYWQTAEDNRRARGLYDKLTGGANGFVVYELGVDDPSI